MSWHTTPLKFLMDVESDLFLVLILRGYEGGWRLCWGLMLYAFCIIFFNALLSRLCHYLIFFSTQYPGCRRGGMMSSSVNFSMCCEDWLIFVIIFLILTLFFYCFTSLLWGYFKGEFWFNSNPLLSLIGSTWYLNTLVALMGRGRVWGFFFVGFDTYMMLFFL